MKKLFLVTLYMKSGNVLQFKARSFSLKYNGQNITEATYETADCRLMHIDVTQIEAATSEKIWW